MNRIVYLHGYKSSPRSTKAQFFGRRFAELRVPFEVPDISAETMAGQLRIIEDACRGEAVTLMGSSLGGFLAALYAARHPEVQRAVLTAPAFCIGRMDLITDASEFEDFPDVRQPVLILHGTEDPVVPVSLSQAFANAHPNVKLLLLNSRHELTDVLEPMWNAVRDFLATPVNAIT
jgi:pimeloyl-ACP methyl ester carboxylesterase